MAIDWLAALGAQDQSFEAQLAKRDLSKKIAMLQDISQQAEQRRQFGQRQGLDERQLEAQISDTAARREDTRTQREAAAKEHATDNKRATFSAIHSGLKPGDKVTDPNTMSLMGEFGVGDQFTQDATDPAAHIYQKQAFEKAQLLAKQKEESDAFKEKAEQHRLDLADKAQARADEGEKRRQDHEKLAQKAAEDKKKKADAALDQIPVFLRPAVKARATQIINQSQGMWESLDPWAKDMNVADAWNQAAMEVAEKARASGQMPIAVPSGGGKGGGPGVVPPGTPSPYLTDEEIKALGLNLPPGSKVRRVGS